MNKKTQKETELALDELVGKYILPFVDKVTKHKTYSLYENLWKHEKIDCGIDPIQEIINHFKNDSYNIEKIAFLKELGRAAYNIPSCEVNDSKKVKEAIEAKALIISQNNYDPEISKCPVCGVNSLITYKDIDFDRDGYSGKIRGILSSWPFIVKCEFCSFEVHLNDIDNASNYGIEGIRDYWV